MNETSQAEFRHKAHHLAEQAAGTERAHAAEETLQPGSLQAEAARHMSRGIAQVADYLGQTDLEQITAKAKRYARDNPAVVLGGAAVLGFAIARFLKSSDPVQTSKDDLDDPWVGHVTATDPASLRVSTSAQDGKSHG